MSSPLCQLQSSLWATTFGLGNRRTGGFFFIGADPILVCCELKVWWRAFGLHAFEFTNVGSNFLQWLPSQRNRKLSPGALRRAVSFEYSIVDEQDFTEGS